MNTATTSHGYRHRAAGAQRADIQGLRAVAVLLVIAQHFWNVPQGGFIGVDIFFVLSGFLISGIILRDIQQHGRVRLPRFYARRLRRIMPVALFVSASTVVLAWFTWFTPQALQYTLDAIWSNLWVANWHFAGAGTDYLAHSANPSPFQHYWSLSVEEQFYVAWPLVLTLAWAIGSKFKKPERAVDIAIGATIILSALWAVLFTDYRAQWAYFDTISRACEFAIGALVARLGTRRKYSPYLGIIGLTLLTISAITITAETPFPGPFALVPAIATALVLLPQQQTVPVVIGLENPAMRWIGDISYSLYLWHFPVLIFMTTWFSNSNLVLIGCLVLTFALSALSYYLVENPIRHSNLLRSWEKPERNQLPSAWIKAGNLVSAVILVVIAAMTVWQFMPSKYAVLAPQTMNVERASATTTYNTLEDVVTAIASSSQLEWSNQLIPSPNQLTQEQMGEAMAPSTSCAVGFGATELKLCEWGASEESAQRTILVIGDSVAMAWTPAVVAASEETDRVVAAGVGSCSIMSIRQEADFEANGFAEKCATTREAMFNLAEKMQPDLIVIASATGGYEYQLDEAGQIITDATQKSENWERATAQTLKQLANYTSHISVLGSPALTGDPRRCMTKTGTTADCSAELQSYQQEKETAEQRAVESTELGATTVNRFDALAVTCVNGTCPVVIGEYLTHTDPTHITQAFAESLAPLIKPVLQP